MLAIRPARVEGYVPEASGWTGEIALTKGGLACICCATFQVFSRCDLRPCTAPHHGRAIPYLSAFSCVLEQHPAACDRLRQPRLWRSSFAVECTSAESLFSLVGDIALDHTPSQACGCLTPPRLKCKSFWKAKCPSMSSSLTLGGKRKSLFKIFCLAKHPRRKAIQNSRAVARKRKMMDLPTAGSTLVASTRLQALSCLRILTPCTNGTRTRKYATPTLRMLSIGKMSLHTSFRTGIV